MGRRPLQRKVAIGKLLQQFSVQRRYTVAAYPQGIVCPHRMRAEQCGHQNGLKVTHKPVSSTCANTKAFVTFAQLVCMPSKGLTNVGLARPAHECSRVIHHRYKQMPESTCLIATLELYDPVSTCAQAECFESTFSLLAGPSPVSPPPLQVANFRPRLSLCQRSYTSWLRMDITK